MTDLLVRVTLDPASGFAGDAVVNTFAFKTDVLIDSAVVLDIHNAVDQFYNATPAGEDAAVKDFLSPQLSRAAGSMKLQMYDITGHLDGSPAGSPIAEDEVTLQAASGTGKSLPPQAAVALTLRGRGAIEQPVEGPGGIRPRQKRTGRIYIGSLMDNATEPGVGTPGRVANTFRNVLTHAAEVLQDSLVDGDYAWCVWSRSNAAMYAIERVECDDSYDVLRSRKLAPTVRTVRTFNPVPSLVLGA
jgi:hypothetical protein